MRRNGKATMRWGRVHLSSSRQCYSQLKIVYLPAGGSVAQEQKLSLVAGERVVLRSGETVLRNDGREEVRSRRENHFFRVEALDGGTAKLKRAEGACIIGFVPLSEVVPVSQGIEFFTAQIETNRRPVRYLMRSLLWLTRQFDIGLGDAEDAVRLAPKDARARSARGQICLAKRGTTECVADFNSEAITP